MNFMNWFHLLCRAYSADRITIQKLAFQKSLLSKEVDGLYQIKSSLSDLATVLNGRAQQKPNHRFRTIVLAVLASNRFQSIPENGVYCRGHTGLSLVREGYVEDISANLPICQHRKLQEHVPILSPIRIAQGICVAEKCQNLVGEVRAMFVDLFAQSQKLQSWITRFQQNQSTMQRNYLELSQKHSKSIQLERLKTRKVQCETLNQMENLKGKLMEVARFQKELRINMSNTIERQREKLIELKAEAELRKEVLSHERDVKTNFVS